MLKPHPTCVICRLIADGDTRLEKRINVSKNWVPGGESLLTISNEYVASGQITNKASIYNHVRRHQAPTVKKLKQAKAKQELQAIEGESAVAKVQAYTHHSVARHELLEIGMEAVRTGDTKMSANVLASLLKQEVDIEEKGKDRSLEMMKMFNYFASGANSNPTAAKGGANTRLHVEDEGDTLIPRAEY